MVPFLDLKAQHSSIRQEIDSAIREVLDSSAFVLGKPVEDFEKEFARYIGVHHCVGLNSGTDALLLALRALGVGPGHEVITVANSFYASVEAILLAGATPVLVDALPKTALMNVTQIKEKINPKTKAIIPVHLYGQPVDMSLLMEVSHYHHVPIIEDACQAHGAVYNGKKVGGFGDIGCFSFYPGKNLGALGDGGAVVTNREDLAQKMRVLRDHGSPRKYEHEEIGTNSRLDGIQAAVLSVKLKKLDGWNQKRVVHAAAYRHALASVPGLQLLDQSPNRTSANHLFVVQVPPQKRMQIIDKLKAHGIGSGIHYPHPLHHLKPLRKLMPQAKFPVSEALCASIISLPMFAELIPAQIEEVVVHLKEALK